MFKTANSDSISRPISRPKLPFPGYGIGAFLQSPEKGEHIREAEGGGGQDLLGVDLPL